MSNISLLIVDDDLNKIESIIAAIKDEYTGFLSIAQASNVQEAIETLRKNEFHLLITDLQMPLRQDDIPDDNGGVALIRSMYKKKNNANIPMYIVGLTQFAKLSSSFQAVWKVWHYDNTLLEWKRNLRDLIFHISLVQSRIVTSKLETIYVEEPTDKKILERSIELFFPDMISKVYVDTINYSGGASWVERQLFIWAKSLNKTSDGLNYLKAVGLFDDDHAGNAAIEKLRKIIDINSAESKTFSILKYSHKYSPILKSVNKKGVDLATTLEELISTKFWGVAKSNGWIQNRVFRAEAFSRNNSCDGIENFNENNLLSLGFNGDEIMYISNKIKDEQKVHFCNYICSLDSDIGKEALLSVKYLLEDIFNKLKLV